MSEDFRNRAEDVLNREIRPAIQMDGGDIELVEADNGVIKVKLTGACAGCPMSTMTLTHFVEERLRAALPDMDELVSV